MYRRFQITLTSESQPLFANVIQYDSDQLVIKEKLIQKLKELYDQDKNSINAKDIEDDWFPTLDYDIFISHSHGDETLAQGLANWLDSSLGLKAFVDSKVWGNRTDLIKELVQQPYCEHCPDVITKVDTILKIALTKMIDKTECFFFLNTNNYLPRPNETDSAWIYYELETVDKIRCKKPFRQIQSQHFQTVQQFVLYLAKVNIAFPVDLTKYVEINLIQWMRAHKKKKQALDELYEMYPICDECCCLWEENVPCEFIEIEKIIIEKIRNISEAGKTFPEVEFYQRLGTFLSESIPNKIIIKELGNYLKKKYGEFLNSSNLLDSVKFVQTCKDCKKYLTWAEARKCLKKNKG